MPDDETPDEPAGRAEPASAPSTPDLDDLALLATHPNAPRQGPVWLAFGLVVLAGVVGGLIGSSLVSATCSSTPPLLQRVLHGAEPAVALPDRSCTGQQLAGTLSGALFAALGAAVVAVLVLRAMAEWKKTPARRT